LARGVKQQLDGKNKSSYTTHTAVARLPGVSEAFLSLRNEMVSILLPGHQIKVFIINLRLQPISASSYIISRLYYITLTLFRILQKKHDPFIFDSL